jgi:P27 family predicted phage terminase small subunit
MNAETRPKTRRLEVNMARPGPKTSPNPVIPLVQGWDPPAHLSARARREFARCTDLLRQRGVIEQVDAELVARRAELVDVAETAYQRLKKDGPFVESDRGNLSPHPAARMHVSACGMIRLIDRELGLVAPQTRVSAQAPEPSGYSRWTRLLAGGDGDPAAGAHRERRAIAARAMGGEEP